MKKFYIYIHTCPNGKKYVGCTTRIKPELRWKKGNGYQYNKHFYSAILKFGWDNITHEVLEVESEEEMYRKEVELISFFHSNDPEYGYNYSTGGEHGFLGCKHSEETRRKISKANKGRPCSEETRKHISEALKGKPVSEETRKHISEVHKGRPYSEEARKHMSEVQKKVHSDPEYRKKISEAAKKRNSDPEYRKRISETLKGRPKPKVKIKLPDGTVVEITKQILARNYINKGRKFEYVS